MLCTSVHVCFGHIESRPTIKQLQDVTRFEDIDITTRWRDLGLELVDSYRIINEIEVNHKDDVRTRCYAMFDKWLERTPNASWSQLVTALNKIGLNTAADAIVKTLQPGN